MKYKRLLIAGFTIFCTCYMFGQNPAPSTSNTARLVYKLPQEKNGLTETEVNFKYKFANIFGVITLIYEAECQGNLLYQYKGREWSFTGSEVEVRSVKPRDPKIRVKVSGPNGFEKEMELWVMTGMGGGAYFGNSSEIKYAKSSSEKNAEEYTLTPIEVTSIGFDRVLDVQSLLDQKLRKEKLSKELAQLERDAENAMSAKNYVEARSIYQKILRQDPTNAYASTQMKRAEGELEKKSAKDKFDNLMAAGEAEEKNDNLQAAQNLYSQAMATGFDNSLAQSKSNTVGEKIYAKKKELENQAKEVQEQIDKDLKKDRFENDKKAKETLTKKKEIEREAEKIMENKLDSIAAQLDQADKKRIEEKKGEYYKKQEEDRKAQEENEKIEEREEEEKRRSQDIKSIASLGQRSYNAEAYYLNLKKAQQLLETALEIKPWEELQLKREWWDNNNYIQYFADDLYEKQRQDNHKNYLMKNSEAAAAMYNAKSQFINTLLYVDEGSREETNIMTSIERCNLQIDFLNKGWKMEWKSEQGRGENRQRARMLQESQILIDNRKKAELVYATLDSQAAYPAENLTKKYELAERMNQAHQTYVQELAVAGISNSVGIELISSTESADGGENYGLLNGYASIGYGQFPILVNETSDLAESKTNIEQFTFTDVSFGIDFWIVRLYNIGVNLGGRANLGLLPSEGSSTAMFNYSGLMNFDYGFKRLKIINTVEYLTRNGEYEIDYDVSSPSNNGPTNRMGKAEFKYTVLRFGAGIKVDLTDEWEASHIILNIFAEKPSFYPENIFSKPIFTYDLEYMNFGGFAIKVGYSKNYVIAGNKQFNIAEPISKDFFHFSIGKYFTLINPKNL